jgi:hypothetical protein
MHGQTSTSLHRPRMHKTNHTTYLRMPECSRTSLPLVFQQKGLLKVHQGPYVQELLTRYKMDDCVPCSVPLSLGVTLTKEGEAVSDEVPFGSLVGALMYLATCTRPDMLKYGVIMLACIPSAKDACEHDYSLFQHTKRTVRSAFAAQHATSPLP